MSRVDRDNYIHISGWMVCDLRLKGNELLVYAIIYGFSQAEEQVFNGSLQYLADWTNSSKTGVSNSLRALVEKGLIQKTDIKKNGVKFCEYYATKLDTVYNKFDDGIQESCIPYTKKLYGGIQESCTNNIDNNKRDIIEDNKKNNKKVYFPLDEKLNEAFKDFLDMRKKMRKPMTDRAITLSIKKLEGMTKDMFGNQDNDKAIEIINQSIEHGWLTFYPLKDEKAGKKTGGIDWDNV